MATKGYKTTEFWLSLLAMLLGALATSGLIAPESLWAKLVGLAVTGLGALGYTASRAKVKGDESKAEALKAAASPPPPA